MTDPNTTTLTPEQIDAIANNGHRNAAGGIYATSVYAFARDIERALLTSPQAAAEPIRLVHVAVAEDGGKLRWMTGRKPRDCELYMMPDGGRAPAVVYAALGAPVAEQKRDDTGRLTSDYEPTAHEIQVAREAIRREFGNNGTDGYYIRILKAIHGAAPKVDPDEVPTDEPRLDKPAQVGGTRFGKGVKWSTVIGAAQRHFDFMQTPDNEARRIARAAELMAAVRDGAAVSPATADTPLNGIAATMFHGEGAIARCSYCGRYSLDPKTLGDRQPKCECGEQHGWSGSFEKPGPDAKWSGAAPPKGRNTCMCSGLGPCERRTDGSCRVSAPANLASAVSRQVVIDWAVDRWTLEVSGRPLGNIHRRSLDDAWRQFIRHLGADDVSLLGPRHDDLIAAHSLSIPLPDSEGGEA
ncbi:hypothetical protein [Burkholderia gladioli]|uniref:hypothetical protein n=1 Tax=Burkholderia gladioli TaxID=28095 RepID=UPI000CFF449B|nr:hypothetical protein [Burkholderia gladioli]PRH13505.1 hypothetical protein C6V08_00420 [Burkholderia gladioli]